MSRKTLSILMLVVFVFSLALTACQPKATEEPTQEEVVPTEPEGGEEEATAEPTEEPEPEVMGVNLSDLDGTTVTFWHVWGEGEPAEGMTAIVEEFNETNEWGITVNAVDQVDYTPIEDAMNAAIQTGDVPDTVVGYANAFGSWYAVDAVVDINQYIENETVGWSAEEQEDFFQGAYENGLMADGTRIGLPLQQSANVIFYNETWAQELGFDNPPANTDEFIEQACAATEANANDDDPDNDGTGGLVIYPSASNMMAWTFAFGGNVLAEDGSGYDFTTEEIQGVAELWKTLMDEGCAFEVDGYPNPEFASRKALFTTSSTAGLPYQKAAFEEEGATDDEWTFIPFVGPDGNQAVNAYVPSITIINSTPEKKLAAWLFIKHFLSPEVQAEWVTYSEYYPVRLSAGDMLEDFKADNPIWAKGLNLLEYGKTEPTIPSWSSVRRAVEDAFAEILQSDMEDIPAILENLDATAAELVAEME